MTNIALSSDSDPTWCAHDQEARLLVELLRSSRLTLLFGETGSDKTALLKSGLMPLLRRRSTDQFAPAAARESGVVIPFPDRRKRFDARTSRRRRELVVYFDDWSGSPLPALHACIRLAAAASPAEEATPPARLAETLQALCARLDANFIFLLDRFEEFLLAPSDREDIAEFADELVEAITQPQLPANFLLSMNTEARPRLASLRGRIPGFDDFSLKLAPRQRFEPPAAPAQLPETPAPLLISAPPLLTEVLKEPNVRSMPVRSEAVAPAPRTVARPKVKRPPPPRVQVKTEDVYALIESTLARTASEAASEPSLPGEPVGPSWAEGTRSPAYEALVRRVPAGPSLSGELGDLGSGVDTYDEPEPPARARSTRLHAAVQWVWRLVRPRSKPRQHR